MKKQLLIFISLVFVLFMFNKVLLRDFSTNTTVTTDDLLNRQKVTSQKLFDKNWRVIRDNFYDSKLNGQDWSYWKKHYAGKILTDEDANVAINTMIESLDDPYSKYLDKKTYSEQTSSISSKITGIGVNITEHSGKTLIVSVIEGTPAQKAGLKSGDLVVKVNDKDITGYKIEQVADIVRGPEGTSVQLTIVRKKKTFVKKIVRQEIKIKTVKSKILNDIGYIQILSFIGSTTSEEFLSALDKTKDTKGLIIDLRGNAGGLLPNAVFISNLFISKGNIVSIVGRSGIKRNVYAQKNTSVIDKPVLILVDEGSASASEIFSGALKDYHKATLVGTKTFGKGMVQKIIPMPNETGLNLTIAKYLTPQGHDINKKGIEPDVVVKLTERDIKQKRDVQLNKAKSMMSEMIAHNNK